MSHLSGTDGGDWRGGLLNGVKNVFVGDFFNPTWTPEMELRIFWRIHQDLKNPKNQFDEVKFPFFRDLPFQETDSTINQMHPQEIHGEFQALGGALHTYPLLHLV